jgi:hypothetical protein
VVGWPRPRSLRDFVGFVQKDSEMSNKPSKANGAEFVAIVTPDGRKYRVECILRRRGDVLGLPSEMETVHNNSDLPPFPPLLFIDARKLVIELAGSHGYAPSEIAWENA